MRSIAFDPTRASLRHAERRETFLTSGTPYTPDQIAAEASRLAYCRVHAHPTEAIRMQDALGNAGFLPPTWFEDHHTKTTGYGALRAEDGLALIVFRGTRDPVNWVTNFKFKPKLWTGGPGLVHAGFAAAAYRLEPHVRAWLDGPAAHRSGLVITGHSLGAALATITAAQWRPDRLITFGSPRVGDSDFVSMLEGIPITRYVNCADRIPDVPPGGLTGYRHAGDAIYVARDGTLHRETEKSFIRKDRAAANRDYLANHFGRWGNLPSRAFADHSPINYIRALFP